MHKREGEEPRAGGRNKKMKTNGGRRSRGASGWDEWMDGWKPPFTSFSSAVTRH